MEALLISPQGLRIVKVPNPAPPTWNERIAMRPITSAYANMGAPTKIAYPYRTFQIISNRCDEIAVYEALQ